jgi:hypothetical protein
MQLVMGFEASDRWTVDLLKLLLKYANRAKRMPAGIWTGDKLDDDKLEVGFHFRHHLDLARRGGGGRVTGTGKHIEEGLIWSKSDGRVAPASLSR